MRPRGTGRRSPACPSTLSVVTALAIATMAPPAMASPPGQAAASESRGPSEIRDEQILAQPRLTLPAVSTEVTPTGRWSLRLASLESNTFTWRQDVSGEEPKVRDYLLDGEAFTLDVTARRGIAHGIDVAVRLPFRWRGGGRLDNLMDAWHRLLHLPDNRRSRFLKNAFRVEGRTTLDEPFAWNERAGAGLGDAEVEARWRVRDGGADATSVAFLGRLSLPTATSPFAGSGWGGAGQVALHRPLSGRFDSYAGFGLTAQDGWLDGIAYETTRAHGFLALEWRPLGALSLVAETNAASRLVANVEHYPGVHWVLNVTGRCDLGRRTRLDIGFTEGLVSQDATTDFALHFAVALRP